MWSVGGERDATQRNRDARHAISRNRLTGVRDRLALNRRLLLCFERVSFSLANNKETTVASPIPLYQNPQSPPPRPFCTPAPSD